MKKRWMSCAAVTLFWTLSSGALAADQTFKRYELVGEPNSLRLEVREAAQPVAQANQVIVRIRAVSLNHRDLYVLEGRGKPGLVPVSDGAGEVVSVGASVTGLKAGDRVATTFFERWIDGVPTIPAITSARGGDVQGVLSEIVVAHPDSLVKIPDHLSFEEAATLPCAALTAWNALFKYGRLQAGQFVLLEGTGGVSIFGLQFATAAGARGVITSSSDAKLERARSLGAAATVNYRQFPEWQTEVLKATKGAGVSHVLEIGGKDTLPRAVQTLGLGGHVAMIGGITGFDSTLEVASLTGRMGSMTGVYVGSREDFAAMNAFIARHRIKPVIDRVFSFAEAPAAYEYLKSGSHFGKVVIRL